MRRVHASFKGQRGTFAQFGDSITNSRAFWFSLRHSRKNASAEMDRAFNMGVGMVVIVGPDDVDALIAELDRAGEAHHAIGEVVAGQGEVRYV